MNKLSSLPGNEDLKISAASYKTSKAIKEYMAGIKVEMRNICCSIKYMRDGFV